MGYIFDAIQKAEADADHNTIGNTPNAQSPDTPADQSANDQITGTTNLPLDNPEPADTDQPSASSQTRDDVSGSDDHNIAPEPTADTYSFVAPQAVNDDDDNEFTSDSDVHAILDAAMADEEHLETESDAPEASADGADDSHPLRFQDLTQQVDDRMVTISDPSSMLAEEYRGIRTRILAGTRQRRLVHTITSASRAEGKTLTSLNLAAVFGEMTERRTIVIEGDLRVPTFRHMLKPESHSPGLIQYLKGEATLDEIIQPLHTPNLSVIYAGGYAAEEALQLLSTNRLSELLAILKRRYDHVIIDTPPVLDVADAGVIGAQSDDVFLMLRMSRTSRRACEKAIEHLRSYNAPVAGVVLTDVQSHAMSYGYKYGYKYAYGRAAA